MKFIKSFEKRIKGVIASSSDEYFFASLEQLAYCVMMSVQILKEMLASPDRAVELHAELKEIEKKGDSAARKIFELLKETFLTPLDREDIVRLTRQLDDNIDIVESVGRRIALLVKVCGSLECFSKILPDTQRLADILTNEALCLPDVMKSLRNGVRISDERQAEIHRLENIGDELWEGDEGFLFSYFRYFHEKRDTPLIGVDLLTVEWKNLTHNIETCIDLTKQTVDHIADIIEKSAP